MRCDDREHFGMSVATPDQLDRMYEAACKYRERDPDVEIRVSATSALAACLNLIMDRESRLRIRWYYGIYETAQAGLRGENERGGGGNVRAIAEAELRTWPHLGP